MPAQREFASEILFEELSTDLQKFIARRIPNRADAEDVLQETLYKIHRSIACLAPQSNLYAWVYRVTRNAIIDHYRKQQPNISLDAASNLSDEIAETMPSRDALQEIAACLRPMLNCLPEKYREALVLTDLEGMTQAELAEHLQISLSGAKSRVQRARTLLKEALLKCCDLEFDHQGRVVDYQCRNPYRC